LHFTAADLAAQHDRRAGLRMLPAGVDHRLQAKHWLGLSDYALDIVRRWDPGTGEMGGAVEHPSLGVVRRVPAPSSPEQIECTAEGVLDRLFRVDAALRGAMPDVDDVVKADLRDAVRDLGDAMRGVRTIVDDVHTLAGGE
jgi:hypothetical protein